MTPILPGVELEVKSKGDLQYLFQSPEFKNGFVLTSTAYDQALAPISSYWTHHKYRQNYKQVTHFDSQGTDDFSFFPYGNTHISPFVTMETQ